MGGTKCLCVCGTQEQLLLTTDCMETGDERAYSHFLQHLSVAAESVTSPPH